MLSCSKRRLSGKISEIEQNDVTDDVINKKRDMLQNKDFVKYSSGHVKNFTPHKYFVKIKSSCSKRRLGGQISEILQNDVNK